jgi:hypothetical protein
MIFVLFTYIYNARLFFLLPDNSVAKHLYFRDGIHLNNHGIVQLLRDNLEAFMLDKMYNVTVNLDKFLGTHPLTDIIASNMHNYALFNS